MNWVGDLIQKNIEKTDSYLDLGCGIMQNLLDFVESYPKTKLECDYLHGVDIFEPYLEFLNEKGVSTTKWDLRETPLPFKDKSFDNVSLTDILEHLDDIKYVDNLLKESERIAKKRIFILTPKIFCENESGVSNPYPYDKFTIDNEYQRHHILLTESYFKNKGFKIIKINHPKYKNLDDEYIFGIKKVYLKILHVWDVAGVAGCMSKYQRRLGHDVKCIIKKSLDTFRFRDVYEYDYFIESKIRIFKGIIRKIKVLSIFIDYIYLWIYIKKYNPDIIHFHVIEYYPLLFPFRKKLIEFHGTRLRNKLADGSINKLKKTPNWIFKIYKIFSIPYFVSTIDLLNDVPDRNIKRLIHNPVDTELFNREKYLKVLYGKALYIKNHYEDSDRAKEISGFLKMDLTIYDRKKDSYFHHKDFPEFLSNFDLFIDRHNIHSLSKTALECLSLDINVIDWNYCFIKELPNYHKPENVAKKTIEIYKEIVGGDNEL